MALILGIDPGSRITGYGIINAVGAQRSYIASGHVKVTGNELADRLGQIYRAVDEVIETYTPQEFAIERVFMARNADSALKLGQARGVAMVVAVGGEVSRGAVPLPTPSSTAFMSAPPSSHPSAASAPQRRCYHSMCPL